MPKQDKDFEIIDQALERQVQDRKSDHEAPNPFATNLSKTLLAILIVMGLVFLYRNRENLARQAIQPSHAPEPLTAISTTSSSKKSFKSDANSPIWAFDYFKNLSLDMKNPTQKGTSLTQLTEENGQPTEEYEADVSKTVIYRTLLKDQEGNRVDSEIHLEFSLVGKEYYLKQKTFFNPVDGPYAVIAKRDEDKLMTTEEYNTLQGNYVSTIEQVLALGGQPTETDYTVYSSGYIELDIDYYPVSGHPRLNFWFENIANIGDEEKGIFTPDLRLFMKDN